ncbi:hypothetical protein QA601_18745 [Chitinispirillales bacterium ANBcel5]|uniref:hypothetical protein n=1 Tax=Cellulosispirillum alkaliphilum TaxID=3039283 RepID=UPI002A518ECF|nr:hypothetical protein [Chitinispirillales bacterium ANBcel5]
MKDLSKKKLVYVLIIFIVPLLSLVAFRLIITDKAMLKFELRNYGGEISRENIYMLIDNLTQEQTEYIRGFFKSRPPAKFNPGIRNFAKGLAVQEIINKNIINVADTFEDTNPFERGYQYQKTSKALNINFDPTLKKYAARVKLNMIFWGDDDFNIYDRKRSSQGVIYRGFSVRWEMPKILNTVGIINNGKNVEEEYESFIQNKNKTEENNKKFKDAISANFLEYIYNIGTGFYHRYNRRLEIEVYRFFGFFRTSAATKTECLLDAFFSPTEIENRNKITKQLEMNNPYFEKEICEVMSKSYGEEKIVTCYGLIDSTVVKMNLDHHIATGCFERSLEVAENVWKSIKIEEERIQ